MKENSKGKIAAILLSLFVYPGTGQFYLGHKKRGTLFGLSFTLVFLGLLIAFQQAVMNQINAVTDLTEIMGSVRQSIQKVWEASSSFYTTGLLLSLLIWIGSAVDILRLKKS